MEVQRREEDMWRYGGGGRYVEVQRREGGMWRYEGGREVCGGTEQGGTEEGGMWRYR